jgi:hypothetical protein
MSHCRCDCTIVLLRSVRSETPLSTRNRVALKPSQSLRCLRWTSHCRPSAIRIADALRCRHSTAQHCGHSLTHSLAAIAARCCALRCGPITGQKARQGGGGGVTTPWSAESNMQRLGLGRLLFCSQPDVDPRDVYGMTPLHLALSRKRSRCTCCNILYQVATLHVLHLKLYNVAQRIGLASAAKNRSQPVAWCADGCSHYRWLQPL